MKNYKVSSEFKTQTTNILTTKKFSAVFSYMNLVNRDGFIYNENELNQIVQFLGEFPYNEVAEFFQLLPTFITEESAITAETNVKDEVKETEETAI